jgi:hypothetical protein
LYRQVLSRFYEDISLILCDGASKHFLPPYTKEEGGQYENPRGNRTLLKTIVSKFDVILLLSVRSLQFSSILYTFSSSLQFSKVKDSFLTQVRVDGMTAHARTGDRYSLWKFSATLFSDFDTGTGGRYDRTHLYGWSPFALDIFFDISSPTSFYSTGGRYDRTRPYGWSLFTQYFCSHFVLSLKNRRLFLSR